MALLGGLILNLMPCVFPVLSLKIFAMAGHGDHSAAVRKQSWVYLLGVVLSFILVAGIMLALRAGGESVGWGFQLQEPLFISLLVYLFFVLGLSFSGVVHIGGSLMGIGQSLVAGSGYRSAFFTGVLAVIVASPCSVPFMGVAVGYAIGQSATAALTIFAVLGAGMALPFVLLAYWPQMLRRLPAPGAWMDRLKQFLAFPLYATCLWLLYVLGEQGGHMAIVWVLGGLILLVMAGWLWRDADAHPSEKLFAILILLCALVLPHFLVVQTCNGDDIIVRSSKNEYEPYSAIRLQELRAEGKPVFVNLTAAWCITCLVNEKVALDHDAVKTHMQQKNITYLKGDWTNRDPEITKLLQQFGRSGVPLYLYFPAEKDSSVVVLPQVLTQSTVIEALR
jgi:thiol:disulfide interchange protein DsbD